MSKKPAATRRLISMQCGGSMSYVRHQKLRAVDDPVAPPGDPSTYPYGQLPDKIESLPVAYWFEGWLVYPPIVGKRVAVLRLVRTVFGAPAYSGQRKSPRLSQGIFARRIRCTRLLR